MRISDWSSDVCSSDLATARWRRHCSHRRTPMASNAEIERSAAGWLAQRESGWSDAEQAEFRSWLDASIAHRVAWIRQETGWQRAARLKALAAGLPPGEVPPPGAWPERSEEHTSELQSLMRISYAVFCLKKHNKRIEQHKK